MLALVVVPSKDRTYLMALLLLHVERAFMHDLPPFQRVCIVDAGMDVTVKMYKVASALHHMYMHRQQLVHQHLHSDSMLCTLHGKGWQLVSFGAASLTRQHGTATWPYSHGVIRCLLPSHLHSLHNVKMY